MTLADKTYALGAAEIAGDRRTLLAQRHGRIIDLGAYSADQSNCIPSEVRDCFRAEDLSMLLGAGPETWQAAHFVALTALADKNASEVQPGFKVLFPFRMADYVDFYASREHAENVGRIFRPHNPELPKAWHALPIGYHGRSSSIVQSGTPIRRPSGLIQDKDGIKFRPSQKLDLEAEVGFVVGTPSRLGESVSIDEFDRYVFGVCLVNDWSARDIQQFEYVPLGPFLGKSFATTISPWITPLSCLNHARNEVPSASDPELASYLKGGEHWGLNIDLEVVINGKIVSRPPYSLMHWSPAQMLAHTTVNGAPLSTGDFFASGTVSGPDPTTAGSLLEITSDATEMIATPNGPRGYLEDGDTVSICGFVKYLDGSSALLGSAEGTVFPAAEYNT